MMIYQTPLDQAWLRLWVDTYGLDSHLRKYLRNVVTPVDREVIVDRAVVRPKPRSIVLDDALSSIESAARLVVPRPQVAKLARDLGEIVTLFLETILSNRYDDQKLTRSQKRANVHLKNVAHAGSHLAEVDFYFMDDLADRMGTGGRYVNDEDRRHYLLSPSSEQVDIFWPLDFATAQGIVPDDPGTKDVMFTINRFRTLSSPEVRGMPIKMMLPRMGLIAFEKIVLGSTSRRNPDFLICGLLNESWKVLNTDIVTPDPRELDSFNDRHIRTIFAGKLTSRYSWHVAFGSEPGSRAVLPTSPRGCLELFRGRDLSLGENRRSALRHWVNEHYRDRSNDPGAMAYVCEHLRGNTRFVWNGLPCELMVSEYDLEKNEFFKTRAAEWRAARVHNRVKVRLKERRR